MTIRRDLDLLQSEGKIQRFHGGAVSHAKGAMAWSPVLVGARQTAMNAADKSVLLADSAKFGYHSLAIFAVLDAFDELITDDRPDESEAGV